MVENIQEQYQRAQGQIGIYFRQILRNYRFSCCSKSLKLFNQISISSVKLNTVKTSLLSEFNSMSVLFFCEFNIFKGHFLWCFMIFSKSGVKASNWK